MSELSDRLAVAKADRIRLDRNLTLENEEIGRYPNKVKTSDLP
jgi:hypothetical protein